MKKIVLMLAFDHELSLGACESYRRNMFQPTDALLELANDIQVPVCLFSDVCCAIKFREWDPDRFFLPFRNQLERAIREGHDVQLHIHPHWLDSQYIDGSFVPAESYSLGVFADRESPHDIAGIINAGVQLLDEICGGVNPDYRCIAYRAGGFSLSPNTSQIIAALHAEGIRIESSIAKGNHLKSNLWEVDHRQMPHAGNWYLGFDGILNLPASDGLYEIPIAARPRTPWNNIPFLVKRFLSRGHQPNQGGGRPIMDGNTSLTDKIARLFPRSAWLLGFDTLIDTVDDLMRTLQYHIDAHADHECLAISTVSHPKLMGDYSFNLMREFVGRVREEYGDLVEFCSYQQFYESYFPDFSQSVPLAESDPSV